MDLGRSPEFCLQLLTCIYRYLLKTGHAPDYPKNSKYDQEITQSQTADKPMAPRGRATQQPRDTRKTN